MRSLFSFTFDGYDGFPGYSRELVRHDTMQYVDEKKFNYQFRVPKTYEVPEKELEPLLATFGEIWGGREYFVIHDHYVIHPITINATKEAVTLVLTGNCKRETSEGLQEKLKVAFAPYIKDSLSINIEWAIPGRQGIQYADVQTVFDEVVHPEAYPYIQDLHSYIRKFLAGSENVLVMMGSPGTGKTRLIKHIVQHISKVRSDSPNILYSMDEKIFSDDGFFFHFLTQQFDALVLEDIDFNLKSRKNGNTFMYKLLGTSDGFIKNPHKKIILSTNLPNVSDIDEALLRKGRCYDVLQTRRLTHEEAEKFIAKVNPEADLKQLDKNEYLLADLYSTGLVPVVKSNANTVLMGMNADRVPGLESSTATHREQNLVGL